MAKPVVVGVDGSPSSLDAVETAAHEAVLSGVGLRLVHAFGWPSVHPPPGGPPWDPARAGVRELVDGTLAEAEQRAREIAPRVDITVDIDRLREEEQRLLDETLSPWQARYPQVAVERRLVRSRIRPALIEASHDAQLVVAGARGRGGFTGLLLGSVSQALLHHAHCSVAVVRGKE